MEVEIPPHEIDECIRRHSKTYRKAVLEFIRNYMRIGERLALHQMTDVLEGHGYRVRNIPWWRQARILRLSSYFRKVEDTWQRVK